MSSNDNQIIEDLCLHFVLDQTIRLSANQKFDEISKHNPFNCFQIKNKKILSAVCLYLSLCEDQKLAITQICTTIGCSISDFGRVYNQVIKDMPELKRKTTSVENLVEVVLKDANFVAEELPALIQRVTQLIELLLQYWFIEGRSPMHLIFGAAYLAWKSLNPFERTKVSLTQFCDIVSIECNRTTAKRVSETFNVLKKLGQKIAGRDKFQFTRRNIAVFIEDILNYKNSLLYDLRVEAHKQFKGKDVNNDQSTEYSIEIFKRSYSSVKNKDKPQLDSQLIEDKQTDEEISDSEIDCYIRNESEVKKIRKLKKWVESQQNGTKRLKK